jgi:hypothetical protein
MQFQNAELLNNIWKAPNTLEIQCNAEVTIANMISDLPRYKQIWFQPEAIANIISLSPMKESYNIKLDSLQDSIFHVTMDDRAIHKFNQSSSGLYYYDTITQGRSNSC